ncbi:uncharacterized protein EDB93DRAFT_1341045 [Suillus bovinus]|uniref:uncharacterized protein n=1 Tax=Suillus bovinus TaxID=48563 RepID=UPI001B87C997|nr:uncharacterized protein EDB93DRAFT_1341045 [Suillus bovinus]KAG2127156.1 hypothetical protein EDB93DRAFT_1341045 [Suillus bovinus]
MAELAAVINKAHSKRATSPFEDRKAKKPKKDNKPAARNDAGMALDVPISPMMLYSKGTYIDIKSKPFNTIYLSALISYPSCESVVLAHSLDQNKSIGFQERKMQFSPELVLVQGFWPVPLAREGIFATWAWLLDSPDDMTQQKAIAILRHWKEGEAVMYQILNDLKQFTTIWMVRASEDTFINEWMTLEETQIKVDGEEIFLKRVKVYVFALSWWPCNQMYAPTKQVQ